MNFTRGQHAEEISGSHRIAGVGFSPLGWILLLLVALPLQAEETASLESLTRTYESGGETERIFALFRAGRLSGRAGETLVQRALDDPHPAVRSRAVLEWLRLRGAAGLNLFRTPLHDQNPRVRRTFLTAARTHVGDAAVPYLLDALADPIPTVRTTAIRELRRLAPPSAVALPLNPP